MHIPTVFAEDNFDNIIKFIAVNPLATLIAQTNDGMEACHIPLFWYKDDANINSQYGYLYGHFGRKNPIYQQALADSSWLIIFQDSGHYISPSWYPSKAKTHKEVPTWNYQVVHVAGRITFQHDDKTKRAIVGRLTRDHERAMNGEAAWRMADAPRDYMETMLAAIVAFRIEITGIAAKSKLSQNREAVDHAGVVASFKARGLDRMAARMRRRDSDD